MFEANASLEPVLRESQRVVAPHARMRINIGCLSDREGESRFEVYQNDTGKSHLSDSGSLIVPNIVLDDYLRQTTLRRVRLLKLDIEGQELAALRGVKEALDAGLIDFVYCEIRSELLALYELKPTDVIEFFLIHGFKAFFCRSRDLIAPVNVRLDNDSILRLEEISDRIPDGTDILAVHRSGFNNTDSMTKTHLRVFGECTHGPLNELITGRRWCSRTSKGMRRFFSIPTRSPSSSGQTF